MGLSNLANLRSTRNDYLIHKVKTIQTQEKFTIFEEEPRVLVIYTGGTLGMVKSDEGYVPKPDFLENYMKSHPSMCDLEYTNKRKVEGEGNEGSAMEWIYTAETLFGKRVKYNILEFKELIDSSNMCIKNYIQIGEVIEKNYFEYEAFIILHGTDTVAYTAAILSFMLENLKKTVIVTCAQIPLTEIRNDADLNILTSLCIAGSYHLPEVVVCFNNQVFRGNRTSKLDINSFSAIQSPNLRPLCELGVKVKFRWYYVQNTCGLAPFKVWKKLDNGIIIITMHPYLTKESFEAQFAMNPKAVILQTYGAGNMSDDQPMILEIIKDQVKKGTIFVNLSQCNQGAVSDIYKTGRELKKLGVIPGSDMTIECALAKLSYLLGKGFPAHRIKEYIGKSIRGELTEDVGSEESSEEAYVKMAAKNITEEQHTQDIFHPINTILFPAKINTLTAEGLIKILKCLNLNNLSLNIKDYDNRTPLHIACIKGKKDIVEFLVEETQIDINIIDNYMNTPLYYAIKCSNYDIAKYLYNKGAVIHTEKKQIVPLVLNSGIFGDLERIHIFLFCKLNLNNIKDHNGRTIGHEAAFMGNYEVLKYLAANTDYDFEALDRFGLSVWAEIKDATLIDEIKSMKKLGKIKEVEEKKEGESK